MKNEKLTIITTLVKSESENRKVQSHRFIEYHLRFGCEVIVVCPDNVNIDIAPNPKLLILDCRANLGVTEKLLLALDAVATPYVAWIADDDFMLKDFAFKALKELDSNDKIAGCDAFIFFLEEKSLRRSNIPYSFLTYKYGLKRKEHDHKGRRFRFQAEYYHPGVIHGVMRKEIMKSAMQFLLDNKVPIRFGDKIFVALTLMHGDIKFIHTVSNIRSHGTRVMLHNASLFYKSEVNHRQLMMYDEIINAVLNYFENLHGTMTPGIKSEILYFLMRASGGLNSYMNKSSFWYRLKAMSIFVEAYIEPLRLSLFNTLIAQEIKVVKTYMKRYALR